MREKSEAWAVAAAVGWSFPATVQLATEAKMEAKAKTFEKPPTPSSPTHAIEDGW